MLRNRLMQLFVATALVGATAGAANADATLAIGMKWEPVNYTKPVLVHTGLGAAGGSKGAGFNSDMGGTTMQGWQNTSFNNYIGAFFGQNGQFGFHVGIDLGYGRMRQGTTGATDNPDVNYFQFGLTLGAKIYFVPPKRDRVAPYFYADFFKYFASTNTNDASVENDQASYVASLASPVGFTLAVGAEYFFSPAFSIGSEIFGFHFAYASGSFRVGDEDFFTKVQYFNMYTAITLNYRFLVTGSVKVREQEGQQMYDTGTPRRPPPSNPPPRRPPPQDAPPSAESVD